MSSDGLGRKRSTTRQHSVEDQALNQIAQEAESRLVARKAARAEAREIRTRELERQQREEEEAEREKEGKPRDPKKDINSRFLANHSSRRDSGESSEDSKDGRELRRELLQLEDKFRRAMVSNAQLDNEKQLLRYQVDILSDELTETVEMYTEVQRELKDRTKELELKKRDYADLEQKSETLAEQLSLRDELIDQHGLVFISDEGGGDGEDRVADKPPRGPGAASGGAGEGVPSTALISKENVKVLETFSGSLDERLRRFATEKASFEKQIKKLKAELESERERAASPRRGAGGDRYTPSRGSVSRSLANGAPVVTAATIEANDNLAETQRELHECRLKQKRAEQEVATLEGTVARLESQCKRYKTAADNGEKFEEELKIERRRWQKELRDLKLAKEELEMQNDSLQKRLEKSKKAGK